MRRGRRRRRVPCWRFRRPDAAAPSRITAGTLFTTTLGASVLPMTTLEPLDVLPIHDRHPDSPERRPRLSLSVDGRDRSAQLQTLHAVPLLGSDGGAGRFEITLWLDRPSLPPSVTGCSRC